MPTAHTSAIIAATIGAVMLLAGILFGRNIWLPDYVVDNVTLRQCCLALWAVLVPAWFTVEERWAPENDEVALKAFRKDQQSAKYAWTVAGAAVAIVIGTAQPMVPSSVTPTAERSPALRP